MWLKPFLKERSFARPLRSVDSPVLLSIASLAGFVAFESIDHTRYSDAPALWTFISGLTLGMGIWSMHFIGMLAWVPPFPLYYSIRPTLLSVLAAIAASWLAMHLTVSYKTGAPQRNLILGAALVGAGICGMHYLGMAALHFSEPVEWSVPGVLLSYAVAFVASLAAIAMLQHGGKENFGIGRQVLASLVIGVAICGMHYIGMLAMMVPPDAVCSRTAYSFSGPELARIGVGNALLFTVCLLVVFYRDKVRLIRAASDARFQAQEASRSAERMGAAGRIAASISHEINNPLEAVMNLLYLAENGQIGTTEKGYLQQAQEDLIRIAEITALTLKFYRQPSGPTEVMLPALLESALTIFSKRLERHHITVERDWSPAVPAAFCREGEIRQVFANLIGNAIDSMRESGGRLTLRVTPDADGINTVVEDTGCGISEDARSRILEPFFTTKGANGTGLGLSICADIVQRHGGTLNFTSGTTPGASGTRFTLFLPARSRVLLALQRDSKAFSGASATQ